MGTKSLSCPPSAEASVFLAERTLSLDEAVRQVQSPKHGALVTFLGCVRDTEGDMPILAIAYEAYREMALKELAEIIEAAERRWGVKLSVQHRTGEVPAGEPSLIVACAGVHRGEAFEACQTVIHKIKSRVPIWKTRFQS
ncbi:MAG: molybdenum cofactor biosynthesis protein MoaE [Elusimicrobia bacterium]|nr:molybdenum cofactor biosynthesis protein MoaE [Elusimicrobiota bacterium]